MTSLSPSCRAGALQACAGAVAAGVLAACLRPPVRPAPLPPPTPASGIYYEEDLPAPATVHLEILDLRNVVSEDKQSVDLLGTLINRGSRPTASVSVKVSALDGAGLPLATVYGVPSTQRIAGDGGTATFSATFPNLPQIDRYHVEAVAR